MLIPIANVADSARIGANFIRDFFLAMANLNLRPTHDLASFLANFFITIR